MIAAIPVPIYPIVLLVFAAIAWVVNTTRAAAAKIDTAAFTPELTPITRLVTPALASPVVDLQRVLDQISNVGLDRSANGSIFARTTGTSGLFLRITPVADATGTLVRLDGRRKISHESLSTADQTMIAFERAFRDRLAAMGHTVTTASSDGVAKAASAVSAASTAASNAPVAPPPVAPAPILAPPAPAAGASPLPPPSTAPDVVPAELRFDDGTVTAIAPIVVVGRDPATTSFPQATAVAIDDRSTMSVSKTHFAIGVDDAGVWVQDLHSTNGLLVDEPDGGTLKILPGRQARIMRGSTIHFGDRRCLCS